MSISKQALGWTIASVAVAVIAVAVSIYYGHQQSHAAVARPVSTTITSSGSGPVSNNTATGAGSQAGNGNQSGTGNAQGQGSKVNSGNTTNFGNTTNIDNKINTADPIPLPPGSREKVTITTETQVTTTRIVHVSKEITIPELPYKHAPASATEKKVAFNFYIALGQWKQGYIGKAVEATNKALMIDPSNPATLDLRAAAQFAAGDYSGAARTWRKAIKADPTNITYYDNLAKAEAGTGIVVVPADRLADKPGTQGIFVVSNQSPDTMRVLWIRDYIPGRGGAIPYDPRHPFNDPPLDNNTVIVYTSPYGSFQPIDPNTPELDVEVTFERIPDKRAQTSTFRFLPKMGPSGIFRWVPKV